MENGHVSLIFPHHLAPATRWFKPWPSYPLVKRSLNRFQKVFFHHPRKGHQQNCKGAVFIFTPVFGWSVRRCIAALPFSRWHLSSSRYSTRPSLLETRRGTLEFKKLTSPPASPKKTAEHFSNKEMDTFQEGFFVWDSVLKNVKNPGGDCYLVKGRSKRYLPRLPKKRFNPQHNGSCEIALVLFQDPPPKQMEHHRWKICSKRSLFAEPGQNLVQQKTQKQPDSLIQSDHFIP